MDQQRLIAGEVLGAIPGGRFVITAAHDSKRAGAPVRSAQVCCEQPWMVCVSLRTGHWIEPLIRDSRRFVLCDADKIATSLLRQMSDPARPRDPDVFEMAQTERLLSAAPVPTAARLAVECEVLRHIDLEADHEIYVGLVLAGRLLAPDGQARSFVLDHTSATIAGDDAKAHGDARATPARAPGARPGRARP